MMVSVMTTSASRRSLDPADHGARVKPLPDESCFVRYGAAVLLLVAIALLVFLVFFGR